MKLTHNRKALTTSMIVSAFLLGVVCTLLIGAATADRKMGFDMDRDEQHLKIVFDEALEKFQNTVGTEQVTFFKSELWDFVELGFWLGLNSQTVNMAQLIAYYDFRIDKNAQGSLVSYTNQFISDQCKRQTNRFAIVMRRKFENNTPEFKATFSDLQKLLGVRADTENASVMCPFEDAGLSLYDTPDIEDEAQ